MSNCNFYLTLIKLSPLWIEIYDTQFIQETVIGGLEQHFPIMQDLFNVMSSRATGKQSELVQEDEGPESATKKLTNQNYAYQNE